LLSSKRKYLVFASFFLLVGVLWSPASNQFVDKRDWSSRIRTTADIAELEWKIKFEIGSAPSESFAFVSSHGRDLFHGFHLTIDLYGNGFLVLTDIGKKPNSYQIVLLGQPITGTHYLEMSFLQSDRKIKWRSFEVFFDGIEVPFISADPKGTIELKNINFSPENFDASFEPNAQKSGKIISESLIVKTWPSHNHTSWLRVTTLSASLVCLLMFLRQCRTRRHR
jgi:hypothetical protein